MTPDEAVREAIVTVFRRFEELGSARHVLIWLREDGVLLPRRADPTARLISWKLSAVRPRALTIATPGSRPSASATPADAMAGTLMWVHMPSGSASSSPAKSCSCQREMTTTALATPVQPRQERGTELSEQPAPQRRCQPQRHPSPGHQPPATTTRRNPLCYSRSARQQTAAAALDAPPAHRGLILRQLDPQQIGMLSDQPACSSEIAGVVGHVVGVPAMQKFAAPRLRSLPERQYLTLWRGRAGPEGKNDVSTQTLSGVSGGGWCWWPRGDDCPWNCDRTDAQVRRTDQTNQSTRSRTTHVPPNRPTNVDATPHIGRPLRAKPRKAQVTARHGLFEELAPQHLVLSSIGGVERATTRPRAG